MSVNIMITDDRPSYVNFILTTDRDQSCKFFLFGPKAKIGLSTALASELAKDYSSVTIANDRALKILKRIKFQSEVAKVLNHAFVHLLVGAMITVGITLIPTPFVAVSLIIAIAKIVFSSVVIFNTGQQLYSHWHRGGTIVSLAYAKRAKEAQELIARLDLEEPGADLCISRSYLHLKSFGSLFEPSTSNADRAAGRETVSSQ